MPRLHCARGLRRRIRRWRTINLETLEYRAMLAATATDPLPDETVEEPDTETIQVVTEETAAETEQASVETLDDLIPVDDRLILEGDCYGLDPIFCLEPTLGTRKLPSLYVGKDYYSTTTYVPSDELVEVPPEYATLEPSGDADTLNGDSAGAYIP